MPVTRDQAQMLTTLAIAGLVFISAGLTAAWRRIEAEQTEFARVTAEDWETE